MNFKELRHKYCWMPGNAIIQEIIGNKTTIGNIIQINKLEWESRKIAKEISRIFVTFLQQIPNLLFFSKKWVAIVSKMTIIRVHKRSDRANALASVESRWFIS